LAWRPQAAQATSSERGPRLRIMPSVIGPISLRILTDRDGGFLSGVLTILNNIVVGPVFRLLSVISTAAPLCYAAGSVCRVSLVIPVHVSAGATGRCAAGDLDTRHGVADSS
jgi:hypothetical protein